MFRLEFKTENDAFKGVDGEDDTFQKDLETCRILEEIIGEIECGHKSGSVLDLNGNKVGSWSR